jgi:hypothetical protein
MSNKGSNFIKVNELSDFDKWSKVISYDSYTYLNPEKYLERYNKGEALLKAPINWDKVAEAVEAGYRDEKQGSEIYLRLAEAHFKKKITTGAELWELTKGKSQNTKDKEEIEYNQLIIDLSNILRYEVYLYYLLNTGAKYNDLLKVEPSEFNLPLDWSTILGYTKEKANKETSILRTICYTYLIDEPGGLMLLPSLRKISKDTEAPYSVVMDSYNLRRSRDINKVDHKVIKAQKEDNILTALPKLMDKIGDKYYQYFIKDEDKKDYRELSPQELKDFKEDVLQELKHEFKTTLSLLIINNLKKEDKIELDELQSLVALDIVRYFSTELIELKTLFYGATRN